MIQNEFDSQFENYRDINQEERRKGINKESNKLAIHKIIQKLNLNDVVMDFDATSLYHSAMWDENSVYPKIKTGFAFEPHMNIIYVDAFNDQNFNRDGNESAILRIKNYSSPDLMFQLLPVKEIVKNIEVKRMRNVYINDTLTSVDIQEIVKIDRKVIEIYEGVIYRENFKISPFRKVIEKLFALRRKYKDEGNDLMQGLVKLIMNSLYGVQMRRNKEEFYKCKSQHWTETEDDENALDYWNLPNGNYILNLKKDVGLDCAKDDVKNTLPSHLEAFILSNCK